jgi:Xaa-Pro aminopeptidase
MKSDIDRLMEKEDVQALFVLGSAAHNASMSYFTGRIHLTHGYLLKVQGQDPVLFHRAMERDEAAKAGLATKKLEDYDPAGLLEASKGDQIQADIDLLQLIFDEFQVRGRISVYGKSELGPTHEVLNRLEQSSGERQFVGEAQRSSILARARMTKSDDEVERMRNMGQITTAVVADVAGFLTSHKAKNGVLENQQGDVLTIGEVKRRINLWLAMRGAENPEGTVFSIGRDAGVPHSVGEADQPVETGKAIVFDIFPTEAGGGYCFDFTRTWCIGHAPDELLALYEDVSTVYDEVFALLKMDTPCRDYQIMVCERFEEAGHPTIMNSPQTEEGYVHNLAHGIGLDVHERPFFRHAEHNTATLNPGMVFTFEPGLYYPEKGMGVRLEDTVWARPDGEFEVLAEFPKDLVLKIPA